MEIKVSYYYLVVERDIPKLDAPLKDRIKRAIKEKLMTSPTIFGLPLRGTLARCWKLRVGDWRIVYSINNNEVKIWAIEHRSIVYDIVLKRI
jgi:mRNA interferase RelE/StbE